MHLLAKLFEKQPSLILNSWPVKFIIPCPDPCNSASRGDVGAREGTWHLEWGLLWTHFIVLEVPGWIMSFYLNFFYRGFNLPFKTLFYCLLLALSLFYGSHLRVATKCCFMLFLSPALFLWLTFIWTAMIVLTILLFLFCELPCISLWRKFMHKQSSGSLLGTPPCYRFSAVYRVTVVKRSGASEVLTCSLWSLLA